MRVFKDWERRWKYLGVGSSSSSFLSLGKKTAKANSSARGTTFTYNTPGGSRNADVMLAAKWTSLDGGSRA